MENAAQPQEIPSHINLFLDSIGLKNILPDPSILKEPWDTFLWVRALILKKFGNTEPQNIDGAFEKFQYFEQYHHKDFPEKSQLIKRMSPSWLSENTAEEAIDNVVGRFWSPKIADEYHHWLEQNYPKIFSARYRTQTKKPQHSPPTVPIRKKIAKWLDETPDQFFEHKFPRWPYARLYRLVVKNNLHDSGTKEYWVLSLTQQELARQAGVSRRSMDRFFAKSKRSGICLKIFAEVRPSLNQKTKTSNKDGLCAIWIFAKTMRQALHISSGWRSVRPHLRKLLSTLRQDKTSQPPPARDIHKKRVESLKCATKPPPKTEPRES